MSPTPNDRPHERTGRHFCASCFKEISAREYFEGDFYCLDCAQKVEEFPLATTPNPTPPDTHSK